MSEHLTLRDIRVLSELARSGRAKAYDLAERLRLPASSVYFSLNRMMALGYVAKIGVEYEITERGIRFLRDVRKLVEFNVIA